MPRVLTGDPGDHRFDAWGHDTWLLPDEDRVRQEILVPDPDRHVPVTHCQICGRPLDAQLTCVACGDETDVERTGDGGTGTFGTPGERQHGIATPGPSAERPAEKAA